jgi:hypothetical protein
VTEYTLHQRSEKDIIRIGQIEICFLLEGKDSNGQLALFEFMVPVGAIVNAGGSPDMEKLKAVLTRHGLVPAPP